MKGLIDQASQQISAENTELACAFIQKTAMEKAMPEMEKRLTEVSSHYICKCTSTCMLDEFSRNLSSVNWHGVMVEGTATPLH